MDLQLKLTTLAAALREDRDRLLDEWLGTLRIGMEKPGAVLTDVELRDHFADLLEDLCNQLEAPLTEATEISALKNAENHSDARWALGYKLSELIRELAALRTVVIATVVEHGSSRLSLHEQSLANIIVHRFFDALVVESATFFTERVARELHDGPCQTVVGVVLKLHVICRTLKPSLAKQLKSLIRILNLTIADIRKISHGFVASAPRLEHGLSFALKEFGAELSHHISCEVQCDPELDFPPEQSLQFYRIAQEAAENARRHARPKKISITFTGKDEDFELRVRDDGCGFDPTGQTTSGIGLCSMQERARRMGALLLIESEPGAGTTITCTLPKAPPSLGSASAAFKQPLAQLSATSRAKVSKTPKRPKG